MTLNHPEKLNAAMLYIKRGLAPDEGGAWFLPRLVRPAGAAKRIFTGDFVNGREAERIGLVNRCVPTAARRYMLKPAPRSCPRTPVTGRWPCA